MTGYPRALQCGLKSSGRFLFWEFIIRHGKTKSGWNNYDIGWERVSHEAAYVQKG